MKLGGGESARGPEGGKGWLGCGGGGSRCMGGSAGGGATWFQLCLDVCVQK